MFANETAAKEWFISNARGALARCLEQITVSRWTSLAKVSPVRRTRTPLRLDCASCRTADLAFWQISFTVATHQRYKVSLEVVVARHGRAVIEFLFNQGPARADAVAAVLQRS